MEEFSENRFGSDDLEDFSLIPDNSNLPIVPQTISKGHNTRKWIYYSTILIVFMIVAAIVLTYQKGINILINTYSKPFVDFKAKNSSENPSDIASMKRDYSKQKVKSQINRDQHIESSEVSSDNNTFLNQRVSKSKVDENIDSHQKTNGSIREITLHPSAYDANKPQISPNITTQPILKNGILSSGQSGLSLYDSKGKLIQTIIKGKDYRETDKINSAMKYYAKRDETRKPKKDVLLSYPINAKSEEIASITAKDFVESGISLCKEGKLDNAIDEFTKATRLNPRYARAYHNRGVVWIMKGEIDRAIEDFNVSIRINPNFTIAYANRGLAWEKKGNLENAYHDYKKAESLGMKTDKIP